jgi:hypothetical protein
VTGRAPTIERLNVEALSALPDEAPVVMLNLMRFREKSLDGHGSGWDAYLRYSALAIKLIRARRGTISWTGTAEAVALGRGGGQSVGLCRPGSLSLARRVHRHDDIARVRAGECRTREWMRGAHDHRHP